MKTLDFLIIGAQKSATTTLFELLRNHPDIVMPAEKEVPFFTDENCDSGDWNDFATRYYRDCPHNKLWAKASPQYMCDPSVPARIKALMPATKLVAILRDPIERSWSHYQMGRRRDTESRSFIEAVDTLLGDAALAAGRSLLPPTHARGYEPESDFYVAWSEYGRILQGYAEHFDREQLLVLYTEDLQARPAETLDRLLHFVGLPVGYRPASLGAHLHRGGSRKIIPSSVRAWMRHRTLLYWFWQHLPDETRGRLRFKFEQWNVRRQSTDIPLPASGREALRHHFSADLEALFEWTESRPGWADRYRVN